MKLNVNLYRLNESYSAIKSIKGNIPDDSTKKIRNIILKYARYILTKFRDLTLTGDAIKNFNMADTGKFNSGNGYAHSVSALKKLVSVLELSEDLKKDLLSTFDNMYWDRYHEVIDKGIKSSDYKDAYHNSLNTLEEYLEKF